MLTYGDFAKPFAAQHYEPIHWKTQSNSFSALPVGLFRRGLLLRAITLHHSTWQ